jgi:hypothetical protein
MDYDHEIQALTTQVEDMRQPMTTACEKWLDATAPWAAEFWQAQARNAIERQPELAEARGLDVLRDLKGKVNHLVANARQYTHDYLIGNERALWPHLQDDMLEPHKDPTVSRSGPRWSYFRLGGGQFNKPSPPGALRYPLGRLLTLVADALAEFGFEAAATRGLAERQPWTQSMLLAIEGYSGTDSELIEKQDAVLELRRQKAQKLAGDMWDAA